MRVVMQKEMIMGKNINKLIRSGEVIVTTKTIIKEAVIEQISGLYDEISDFHNNRYMNANDREFRLLTDQEKEDIADDVVDFLKGE